MFSLPTFGTFYKVKILFEKEEHVIIVVSPWNGKIIMKGDSESVLTWYKLINWYVLI